MVDGEASKTYSREADSRYDKEHCKRCVAADVTSGNQADARRYKPCNIYI